MERKRWEKKNCDPYTYVIGRGVIVPRPLAKPNVSRMPWVFSQPPS
jgi:hypothetical protein